MTVLNSILRPMVDPVGINNYPGVSFRCFTKGDTVPFQFTLQDEKGDPIPITGYSCFVVVSNVELKTADDLTDQVSIEVAIPIADAANGLFEGDISDSDSNSLVAGINYAMVFFVTPGGAQHIIDMAILEVFPSLSETVK